MLTMLCCRCKEHHFGSNQNMCIGSPVVYKALVHVFCALLWHTQALHDDIDRYGTSLSHITEAFL